MKNFAQSQEVVNAAYGLAEEIRDGRWRHVFDPSSQSESNCPELIQELQRRCPGYVEAAYKRALADGMLATR